ncbi:MAG: ankyrin repeat domain-containing protein [Capsulimonas sp.]|uniref:ankyrin repeat domain-containing protein n=1 Tax=Capsulimonas sp. TaxID=2494211 RepID=UPI003266D8DD
MILISTTKKTTDPRFYELRDAACSDIDAAAALIESDPTILDARNSIGETAFHYIVAENEVEVARWMLERGSDVNTRNSFGATPLVEAAGLGYLNMCKLLLKHNADLKMQNDCGDTAIATAAEHGKVAVMKYLMKQVSSEESILLYFSSLTMTQMVRENGRVAELLKEREVTE